ncbi:MAG: hypothetical protein GKR89_24665 [Candidatus Latescibacteria bacterium]|nr:hypothetical protein [Candidatus Latescibacterota bacterium]
MIRFIATALVVALPLSVAAQVEVYQVGTGGQSWESQSSVAAGVDIQESDLIRPISFVDTDNIISALRWSADATQDFIAEGDGHIWDNAAIEGDDLVLVDGIDTTSTDLRFKTLGIDQTGRIFFIDFGASLPVNRIQFFPRPSNEDEFPRAYEFSVNDGRSFSQQGQPLYEVLTRVDLQLESVAQVTFPVQLIRFVKLRILSPNPFEIADFEAFGVGFVPKGTYISNQIQFPQPVNFGTLTVKATKLRRQEDGELLPEPAAEANVSVIVRNGSDDTPLVYNEITDRETGSEIVTTEADYFNLAEDFRGSIVDDSENWTWENPLEITDSGVYTLDLDLPGPRAYFDFRMLFEGTSTDGIQIDSLAITYSQPLTSQAFGEVAILGNPLPERGVITVPAGQDTTFTYDVRAEFTGTGQPGYDGLRIKTQSEPDFLKLEIGDPLQEVTPDSVATDDDGLSVFFSDNRITRTNNQPVRVTFRTAILVYTTILSGDLLDSQGALPQPIAPGDANLAVNTNTLSVFFSSAKGGDVVSELELQPPVFSPNGDGINDETRVAFEVLRLVEPVDFEIDIYDLSGRRLRRLPVGQRAAGTFDELTWDGRDEAGNLVPPGVYILRVTAAIESGDEGFARTITVAY